MHVPTKVIWKQFETDFIITMYYCFQDCCYCCLDTMYFLLRANLDLTKDFVLFTALTIELYHQGDNGQYFHEY
jgi:hypothetical protein